MAGRAAARRRGGRGKARRLHGAGAGAGAAAGREPSLWGRPHLLIRLAAAVCSGTATSQAVPPAIREVLGP